MVQSRPDFGDFYRPLGPGKYTLVVTAPGYPPREVNITVPEDGRGVSRVFVFPANTIHGTKADLDAAEP